MTDTADRTVVSLGSLLAGQWVTGEPGVQLRNPADGSLLAVTHQPEGGFEQPFAFARREGGSALRSLTFAARGKLLSGVAEALTARRGDWHEISRLNSGNTAADSAIDVDGAIATLKAYARLGGLLGETTQLADGTVQSLSRDGSFAARHVGVPVRGLAVHINAYNFPSWGLWGKAAVALLSGVPVFAKPATPSAWLAYEMVREVDKAGVLPSGALSLLCGPPDGLLDALQFGDIVAFTGSARTGQKIRSHPRVLQAGVRVNIEADSLNAAVLGPDGAPGSASFDNIVREVVKELTIKAGQKCTAIRRVFAPAATADALAQAIGAALQAIRVGEPGEADMGPLMTPEQQKTVAVGIQQLEAAGARRVTSIAVPEVGAYSAPTVLLADGTVDLVHELEVFGPVATVALYDSPAQAFDLVNRGGGSLVASVFSADTDFLQQAVAELGHAHGRLLLVDPSISTAHTGHGLVLPGCNHGGPGRAGDGAELGGPRGLWLYHQRCAIQASAEVLAQLESRLATQPL